MSEMVKLIINDQEMEAEKGSLLIDKLLDEDIHIPHFCYHKALGKDGNCRMCMVEIAGQKRPQIACDTPVKEGMIVSTKSDNIMAVRRDILELQLINHPIDCPTCDQAGECKLQDFYMESGFYESRVNVEEKNHARKRVELGANVMLDQERCVLCTRCVRFCKDIIGSAELGVESRADHSVITTFPGRPLSNPYAMNVVDLCPVGALTSKDFRFKQRVWFMESFNAICNGCSKGCNIFVDHRKEKYADDKIHRFRPRPNTDINGYFICDYGRLSYKNEEENRFEKALVNGKEDITSNAIVALYSEVAKNNNALFLIGPNLCLEEMQNIKAFADAVKANISGYSPQYIDESFGDDYLRKNDKSANRNSFKEVGISEDEASFKTYLEASSLVVVFDNTYFENNIELISGKKVISCFAHNTKTIEKSDIAIPIASFYEKSGTYINADGIKQKVVSGLNRDNQANTISSIVETIKSMIEKGNI
ncbi:2Fe-2S iron-sulfur cluster-binding protein [Arcobacter sp.]|uniref:2Fe-2S iron-sulfur cluster-binding protein n=1 Tax=Arcobacter sp. TaxID=1872629 RepID=UPI003D13A944